MLPVIVRFRIHQAQRRPLGFYFPIILVWIVLAALLIVLFPVALLTALLTWRRGPGAALLLVFPLLTAVLWRLS